MTPEELLARYPHNPALDVRALIGCARLGAVPDESMRGYLAAVYVRNAERWESDERVERESWFDVPEEQLGVPTDEDELAAWDRRNGLLKREWDGFWLRIREHEREQRSKHGARFRGVDRSRAAQAFRRVLQRKYSQTDPTKAWELWDDARRVASGKVAR